MSERKSNPPFLNGVPELLILQLLSRRAMHGYELVQSIRTASHDGLEFGEGCVYPILHRLESQRLLKASRESVGGRERLVYHVTAKGKSQLAQSISSWQQVVTSINHVLQGGDRGRAALA